MVGHNDGGVLVMRRYGHLFPNALQAAAQSLDRLLQESIDAASVRHDPQSTVPKRRNQAKKPDGRTWDRTRDLSRVKRALSR